MRAIHIGITALALACASVTANAQQYAAGDTVITAARMIDARNGRVIADPQIVVSNGRIARIGKAGDPLPPNAKRVDLPGMTVLPGLIDMHTHIDSDPTYSGYSNLQFNDRFWSMMTMVNADKTLKAGFTTIRNVGADAWNDVGYRQLVEEGKLPGGLHIVTAGPSFGATGGHCDSTYFPPSMKQESEFVADNVEEARKRVRQIRKYGAQVIKICATGGVFSRNTEPGQQQMTEAEMRAVADEAHQWGLKVAAHAHGTSGIKAAIRAGIDTIEHASLIDDEGIKLAKQHGTYLSMDIYNTEYTQSEGKKNGVLEDNLRKDREVADAQREGFRKAHAAGVKMVYGTDTGVYPHADSGKQFRWMVKYGMTPMQAIQSATINAAEALGTMGKNVGVIEAGRDADIIAVPGDPTADVTLLENVPFVMKNGYVVKGP